MCLPHRWLRVFLLCLMCHMGLHPLCLHAQDEARYNRFQYRKVSWRVYHTKAFHIYYPADAPDSLYADIASQARDAIAHVKKETISEPPSGLNIIVYLSLNRFYESNIGINDAGAKPFPTFIWRGKRVVVTYNGSYQQLKEQLYVGISRALWESQISGAGADEATERATPSKLKRDIPAWYKEGAIKYFSLGWTIQNEDDLMNGYITQNYTSWDQVVARQPEAGGVAFCYFLSHNYYPQAVAQTLFQLKKKKSLVRALRLITKRDLDTLTNQCYQFYLKRFAANSMLTNDTTSATITIPRTTGVLKNVLISTDKSQIAYTVYRDGKRITYNYDTREKSTVKMSVYKLPPWISGHSFNQYPLLKWHGDRNDLYVLQPNKGKLVSRRYISNGVLLEKNVIPLVDGITSFTPENDRQFLIAAYRKGQSDILDYDDNHEKFKTITNDEYDDDEPIATDDGHVFISNRPKVYQERKTYLIGVGYKKDTLWQGLYSVLHGSVFPLVTDTVGYIRYTQPIALRDGNIMLSETTMGSMRYALYNSNGEELKQTAYTSNVQYMRKTNEINLYAGHNDSIGVMIEPLKYWLDHNSVAARKASPWLDDHIALKAKQDKEDSVLNRGKDTTHFILDDIFAAPTDTVKGKKTSKQTGRTKNTTRPYILQLHSAYFTAQVNNDLFINRYQPCKNYLGQFKFPEVGGLTKGGFTDLFENHNFSVLYRLPAANQGSDFSVRYENLVHKVDWGLTYFRKVETLPPNQNKDWIDENGRKYPSKAKIKTHYYNAFLKYPVTYDIGISLETSLRKDQTIFIATDKYSLDFPSLDASWSITNFTFKVNKLHPTLPSLFRGWQLAYHADLFKGFDRDQHLVTGNSIDLSYHQPLYKYITLVSQVHAGYSGGDNKVLYILGGIERNLTAQQDTSKHFSQLAPYSFQRLVTPLRGYLQNAAYGNKYLLFNSDVYFPLFQTLITIKTALPFVNGLQPGILCDIVRADETWNSVQQTVRWQYSYGLSLRSKLARYPLRIDLAWPGTFSKKPVWYFSLSL